jgi:hypothetical protein
MSNIAANREKRALDNDRLMSRRAINFQQRRIAEELLGDMGKDMNDVLSGKVKVKLPLLMRIKYKINFWLNKLFKTF